MNTRLVQFAGSTVAIQTDGETPDRLVEFLFRHIPIGEPAAPHFTYRLETSIADQTLSLYAGDRLEWSTDSAASMAAHLLDRTGYHLADRSQGGLLLHAAALSRCGKEHPQNTGLLLPGATASGKSTLAAWLALHGCDYLTDELAFIPWDSHACHGFTRPFNLKPGARPLFPGILESISAASSPGLLRSPDHDLLDPDLLRPGCTRSSAPLHAIIFPRFDPQAAFCMQPLTPAQAGLALMQCLINARNLPEHGFRQVTRLVQSLPAYRMVYNCFDALFETISSLF